MLEGNEKNKNETDALKLSIRKRRLSAMAVSALPDDKSINAEKKSEITDDGDCLCGLFPCLVKLFRQAEKISHSATTETFSKPNEPVITIHTGFSPR